MREMLKTLTPVQTAELPEQELERAILVAMAERAATKGGGMATKLEPAFEVIQHLRMNHPNYSHQESRPLEQRVDRCFRRAFRNLEQKGLIEPAPGMNGAHGFMILTPEGLEASRSPLDLDAINARALLRQEMLHPKLRGKPFKDFADGEPTSAVQEAFKIVEIEVRAAARMPNGHGQNLMQEAFEPTSGPLTDQSESETMRRALPKLFAGAMGRFRNPSTHTQRSFPDLVEAIEELLVASRLLRFLDEPARRPRP